MHMSSLDVTIVIVYILLIFSIAFRANRFMKWHSLTHRKDGSRFKYIENHYLAGKTINFWEATLSIIATEFSALAFLTIPTFVYFENLSYIRFVIGACISRSIIAFIFLPKVYGKGLTIFEALARGVRGYEIINRQARRGKRVFAFFYVVTKVVGTSMKLLGGAILISEFFEFSLFFSVFLISMMTYAYIVIGGLKAVVRTDRLQIIVFVLGGLGAHYIIGKMSPSTWGELWSYGWQAGKFSLFSDASGALTFIYGILAGILYDAATHGVDQDLIQKLFGSKDIKTAQKALAWSAVGSFFVNLLFLSLGVLLWAYYTKQGQALPKPEKIFSGLIEGYFPTPLKGLMVASILAACMSTLDSSINALSAVFWNDLMSVTDTKKFRLFINLDNFIITVAVVVVTYLFSLVPGAMKFGLQFAYLSTGPLLAFFICRMLLFKYIKIDFSPFLIFLSVLSCFMGMGLNHFRFGFNPQLTLLWGIMTTMIFLWIYSKVTEFFTHKDERIK